MSLFSYNSRKYRARIANLSRYFGQHSIEANGYQNIYLGGGNSSINDGNTLWVKLSGTSFRNIKPGDFGELDLEKLNEGLKSINSLCMNVLKSDYTRDFKPVIDLDEIASSLLIKVNKLKGEPSVEAGMHARLNGTRSKPKWNIHDHNTIINSMLCANDAEKAYNDIFGSSNKKIRYLEFIEPGAPLFAVFNEKMDEWEKEGEIQAILFLQHGTMQTGQSPKEVVDIHNNIIDKVNEYIKDNMPQEIFQNEGKTMLNDSVMETVEKYIEELFPNNYINKVKCDDELIKNMLCSKYALDKLSQGMPNPDAAVYGNAATMNIDYNWHKSDLKDKIAEAKGEYQAKYEAFNINKEPYIPKIILIPKAGIITIGRNKKVTENAYAALLDTVYVMRGAEAFGGMKPLSTKHLFYINNWAAEKRRAAKAS